MDLQFIKDNFRKFKRTELDGWGGPLEDILKAMFGEIVALPFDVTYVELFDRSRAVVYTLFDLEHDSDEDCVMRVVAIDDKPLGLAFKFGDRSHWDSRIMDVELFRALASEMAAAVLEKRLAKVVADDMDTMQKLGNFYLFFLGSEESMFAVQSPKWMCGFQHLLSSHRGYLVDENGAAQPLEAIGKFTNHKHHSSDADAHDVVVTVAGQERIVRGQQLMFELIPDGGDIENALQAYEKTPGWIVESLDTRRKVANVMIRTLGHWSTTTSTVLFKSEEDLQRFAAAHFDHDKQGAEQFVQGPFDPVAAGFDVEMSRC